MTPSAIHGLKATGKRYEARDIANSGLLVRVAADGKKHWGFRARIKTGVKGKSPEYSASFGPVLMGAGGKPDRGNVLKAREWASHLRNLTNDGINPKNVKQQEAAIPTMSEMWEIYTASYNYKKLKQGTQSSYESKWRLHVEPKIGKIKVTNLDTPTIQRLYYGAKESGRQAAQVLATIRVIMKEAVLAGHIKHNPCSGVITESEKRITWERLIGQERVKLLNAAYADSEDAGLIVELALMTGARKDEILKARWEHIRPVEDGKARWHKPNTKQGTPHNSTIPTKLYQKLKAWQNRDGLQRIRGWVFSSPVNPENPREDTRAFFNRARAAIGKPNIRFHDLRHDFGTQLALAGFNIHEIMAAMGHAQVQTTMRYISLAEAEKASLATADRERAIEEARAVSEAAG